MKILHISETGLPDWRIEKSALTGKKEGHEVYFAGKLESPFSRTEKDIFSKIFDISWSSRAMDGFDPDWGQVKNQVRKIVEILRPDIIHAHNIFAAKVVADFGIPFVYDDHEFWSKAVLAMAENRKNRKILHNHSLPMRLLRQLGRKLLLMRINQRSIKLLSEWEAEIVTSRPTIVPSDHISEELKLKYSTNNLLVVPNYPPRKELENINEPLEYSALSSVYIGSDKSLDNAVAHRNMNGLIEIFEREDLGTLYTIGDLPSSAKCKSLGFIQNRTEIYREMSKHSVGLIPFRLHWLQKYKNPNKAYEYAHCGLLVMTISGFEPVTRTLGKHCVPFDDFKDMVSKLSYFRDHKDELYTRRAKTYKFAHENLIWEKHEKEILHAYKIC